MDAAIFTVIGEPTRLRILEALRERAQAVGDLVAALGSTQPTISKHLKVLREAELVNCRVDAQRRIYELNAEPLQEIDAWLQPYRDRWNHSLDALEQYLDDTDREDE